jgi:hypothetical protein
MKRLLPLHSIFSLAIILASCSSTGMLTKQQDRPASDGAVAYEPIEQPVPEVEEEKGFLGLKKDNPVSKTADNGLKVIKKVSGFTKTIASTSFKKLAPDRNTASSDSKTDISLGQILIVLLILVLLAVLVDRGLGGIISLLISLLVIVLLVLLILWLLGKI